MQSGIIVILSCFIICDKRAYQRRPRQTRSGIQSGSMIPVFFETTELKFVAAEPMPGKGNGAQYLMQFSCITNRLSTTFPSRKEQCHKSFLIRDLIPGFSSPPIRGLPCGAHKDDG